ncbi:MAG: rhodanese-like domain-containing protein [Saprospiraceae bacterium]
MKYFSMVIGTVLLLLSTSYLSSAQTKLSVSQFDSLIHKDKTIQLIDVRTPAELATGVIKGSKNIDYSSADFVTRMSALDKSKSIAVYCAVGGRSGKSATKLKELGFTQIYDLAGGMTAWNAQKMPVVLPAHQ